MATKIKADTLQALADWNAGKPVKSLELGHCHRMKESAESTAAPQIDMSKHIHRDQERAYAYLFHLIESFKLNGIPATHEAFMEACDAYELAFEKMVEGELIPEERDGAESLAWKALLVGWQRAIAGHDPSMYIEVTNPAVQASAT
jgi:hypothetical protein